MNYRIFTLLLSILFLNTLSFAQSSAGGASYTPKEDPLKIDRPKSSWLNVGGKKWIKMEFKVTCRGDLEARAAKKDSTWLEGIEFALTCAFEYNNKDTGKKDMAWFSSDVEFYVMERNKDYLVNFYIPWDIAEKYNFLRYEPIGYMIDLRANGREYALNGDNYKDRCSASNTSGVNPLRDAISKADLSSNEGVMLYYDELPYIVIDSDSVSQSKLPTSVKKK